MLIRLISGLVFALISQTACSQNPSAPQEFWQNFQSAVINNDINKVMTLTHFPLEVRGVSDASSVEKLNKKQFRKRYTQLMMQKVDLVKNDSLVEIPLRIAVGQKGLLTQENYLTDTQLRVLQFEFEKRGNKWLLTRTYLEE